MDKNARIERSTDGWWLIIDQLSIALPPIDGESPYDAWTLPDLIAYFADRIDKPERTPEAPIPPPRSDMVIPLPIPEAPSPISFFDVLERRRTIYQYGDPISIEQVSALLYYAARVKGMVSGALYDSTIRPYPSAGAAYEVEIYGLVAACDGIEAGFYHYRADIHAFEPMTVSKTHRQMMVDEAIQQTAHQIEHVQIALYLTARMRRINWKDRALSLAYQDAGVLIQTLYLSAAALNLAPCALGGVDPLRFSQMTEVPSNDEPLLSGFLIGSKRHE